MFHQVIANFSAAGSWSRAGQWVTVRRMAARHLSSGRSRRPESRGREVRKLAQRRRIARRGLVNDSIVNEATRCAAWFADRRSSRFGTSVGRRRRSTSTSRAFNRRRSNSNRVIYSPGKAAFPRKPRGLTEIAAGADRNKMRVFTRKPVSSARDPSTCRSGRRRRRDIVRRPARVTVVSRNHRHWSSKQARRVRRSSYDSDHHAGGHRVVFGSSPPPAVSFVVSIRGPRGGSRRREMKSPHLDQAVSVGARRSSAISRGGFARVVGGRVRERPPRSRGWSRSAVPEACRAGCGRPNRPISSLMRRRHQRPGDGDRRRSSSRYDTLTSGDEIRVVFVRRAARARLGRTTSSTTRHKPPTHLPGVAVTFAS